LFSQSTILEVLKKKQPISVIHHYVTGKVALATSNPILDQNNTIVGAIAVVRDISELIELKNELEKTRDFSNRIFHELNQLRGQITSTPNIISESEAMKRIMQMVARVAYFDTTVMIYGESGVGKEVVAKLIHQISSRKEHSFISVNCAAIPYNLAESEFFGYAKGSFTGASKQGHIGLMEMADNGTLFLDEVGELPLDIQSKLLRALQEKEIRPVGGEKMVNINVRVIAATNSNLWQAVKKGKFREDLYYRLNVIPMQIPPLKERLSDIKPLALFFLQCLNTKYHTQKTIDDKALKALKYYHWPGNVRELENLIEYLYIVSEEHNIELYHLPPQLHAPCMELNETKDGYLKEALNTLEKSLMLSALKGNSLRKAAKLLGVDPATFMRKMKKYNIDSNTLKKEKLE